MSPDTIQEAFTSTELDRFLSQLDHDLAAMLIELDLWFANQHLKDPVGYDF